MGELVQGQRQPHPRVFYTLISSVFSFLGFYGSSSSAFQSFLCSLMDPFENPTPFCGVGGKSMGWSSLGWMQQLCEELFKNCLKAGLMMLSLFDMVTPPFGILERWYYVVKMPGQNDGWVYPGLQK